MDTKSIFDSSYEFIELHRTFHELSEHSGENSDIDISRTYSLGNPLRWPDLIKEYRLIILSEAGSGKTAEIFNVACTLKEQGRPAFFLRLESIPGDFEDAFEVGTYEVFEEWLASGEDGWLFLDSVDEARLRNPGDFELAIRKVGRKIKTAKDRTHIVLTGRTTAWRPKTDLSYCTYHLPYSLMVTSESDSQDEDDAPEGSVQTKTETQNTPKTPFKIVALDDLTTDQIAVFAKARGICNSKALLDAVERADAWSFTSRPQDLEELTDFWIAKGRIGNRLEIMQNSIERRLAERDQGRAEARPLAAERARKGARLLAAATTLVQDPTIRVPDGMENSKGIAVQTVLFDWDDGIEIRQAYKTPQYLKSLYLLMHEHIRRNEDIDRIGTGAYSPGLRDNAQEARNNLFELLIKIPGKESFLALKDIAMAYPVEEHRPWMMHHAKTKAEEDGDLAPWSPAQVKDFNEESECTPRNHRELAELAILRLRDLKDDLENGDSSIAGILQTVKQETEIRKFIGRELREKAFGRYSIPQEEEFADAKKPDLRFHGVGFDEPVPVELKLADNWTGPELFERLENQLCGDYLRDNRSRRGIFILVYWPATLSGSIRNKNEDVPMI